MKRLSLLLLLTSAAHADIIRGPVWSTFPAFTGICSGFSNAVGCEFGEERYLSDVNEVLARYLFGPYFHDSGVPPVVIVPPVDIPVVPELPNVPLVTPEPRYFLVLILMYGALLLGRNLAKQ